MSVITAHSRRCHLTKENITESELTLQQAGYFGKTAQQGEKMIVCPIHRATLGKDWGNPVGDFLQPRTLVHLKWLGEHN